MKTKMKIFDIVIKVLMFFGGVGFMIGTFFMLELLLRSNLCH
ncbi:hypothetical protein UFOVP96_23 [uncultured Caudovirales phage]|uniref:Uncharacterized protein n=1 Tax=uncultured Caudovirales phage TaxID=2100421 RepID=A0A6J5L2B0_9CAUD|nr:hypothetical protein UFOVP96_23 [uncultured Caudovirales phage]